MIGGAELGPVTRVPGDVFGDTWSTCEGPDGRLFAAADDTRGFGDVCSSNLAINTIDGYPPELTGVTVNAMPEYGAMCEVGPDRANWKACGIAAVDGSLYLAVSRHHYMRPPFWQQEAWDSSIVRSDDGGASWTPAPKIGASMFPGPTFATPMFVDHGPDVANAPHDADRYLYALSTTGHWNNGNAMTLGRVRRDLVGRLDPGDWEFAHGYFADGKPDVADQTVETPVWDRRHDTALPVFQAPGRTGMAGATWIPAIERYVLPQWYFPHLERRSPQRFQHSCWRLYSAPAPWGPWTQFHEQDFTPEGFYNPSIPSRFVRDDGRSMWLLTCGDFVTHAHYALHAVELTLHLDTEDADTRSGGA